MKARAGEPSEMTTGPIALTEQDAGELRRLIRSTASERHDREHIESLQQELDRADIVTATRVTPDIVTMRSRVRVRDLETGKTVIYTIVLPMDADAAAGRVSVVAPIGTALLGCRAGDVVEWQMPGGRRRLLAEEVLYQPEAAGDEPPQEVRMIPARGVAPRRGRR